MIIMMLDKEATLKEIGYRIRIKREEKGFSVQSLADILEIESTNLTRIEKGRTNFTIGTLVKIANGLDVPLLEFFK